MLNFYNHVHNAGNIVLILYKIICVPVKRRNMHSHKKQCLFLHQLFDFRMPHHKPNILDKVRRRTITGAIFQLKKY